MHLASEHLTNLLLVDYTNLHQACFVLFTRDAWWGQIIMEKSDCIAKLLSFH